jgi:hypothetical protein
LTDQQLYLTKGIPTLAVLVGIMVNVGYFVAINGRINALETRFDARINSLEAKFDTKLDLLAGQVTELVNRLVRLEERLKH